MSEQRLKQIRRRYNQATPGDWFWDCGTMFARIENKRVKLSKFEDNEGWDRRVRIIETDSGVYPPRDKDREFIAWARKDIKFLLDEIERLKKGKK